ncbi:MAG TPA: MmcQ/YjbR family DNA-binding protein [Vicinamibacteria bacterium]|jgi:hypothetical protein
MALETRRGTGWERLCRDAVRLPGVELGTSYGTPALFVRRKLIARLREDGETVAVRAEFSDRDVLLQADPTAFFLTDHYRAYPWVLLRLAKARHASALEVIERAWREVAPRRLVASLSSPPRGEATRRARP